MVSTRGIKVKFTDGEKVLCYEPDPTKAKVLYNSKVLQVLFNKDAKSKKQLEYFIHFQGWNASWDRKVPEEYVLKDTEENRALQKHLAEKANIKLSIKSNRVLLGSGSREKKRRRRLSETIRETIERERKKAGESDTSSSQTGTLSSDDTDSLSSSGVESTTTTNNDQDNDNDDEDEIGLTCEEVIVKHVPLSIPPSLKEVIERDFCFINEKNKLVNLPSSKCLLSILEDYVRFFAFRYIAQDKTRRRTEAREKDKSFMTLDLCKEVMDGIRICFDFYVHSLLLYPRERHQAEQLKKASPIKLPKSEAETIVYKSSNHRKQSVEEPTEEKKKNNIKEEKNELTPRRMLRSKRSLPDDSIEELTQNNQIQQTSVACESGRSTPTTLVSGTSGAEGSLCFSGGNILDSRSEMNFENWSLLPESYRLPGTPVVIYGAVHLLRLFVKMPEILYRMNLTRERKKIILHHMELFLEYLNLHSKDLFPDSNYINYSDL